MKDKLKKVYDFLIDAEDSWVFPRLILRLASLIGFVTSFLLMIAGIVLCLCFQFEGGVCSIGVGVIGLLLSVFIKTMQAWAKEAEDTYR